MDSVRSTQDEAHQLAAAGAAHGIAVAARVQTGGRGTRGRDWISEAGGLWLSVICRPDIGSAFEVVGLRVGLALAAYLDELVLPPARIALKWPNDLLLGRRKVGGILIEARWHGELLGWITVGVGINLRNRVSERATPAAARLLDAGVVLTPSDLAAPVARVVAGAALRATPLDPEELAAFKERDWLRGRALGPPEPGIADGISAGGRLRVRRADGTVTEILGAVRLAETGG